MSFQETHGILHLQKLHNFDEIFKQLSEGITPDEVLSSFNSDKINSDLKNDFEKINELFSGNSLEDIFGRMENDNSEFSQKNLSFPECFKGFWPFTNPTFFQKC